MTFYINHRHSIDISFAMQLYLIATQRVLYSSIQVPNNFINNTIALTWVKIPVCRNTKVHCLLGRQTTANSDRE